MEIAVPFQTPVAIVPTLVSEELTTLDANVVPVRVPAGAITTFVLAAVICPSAFTVNDGIAVEPPYEPAPTPVTARADDGMVVDAVKALDPLAYKYPVRELRIGATVNVAAPVKVDVVPTDKDPTVVRLVTVGVAVYEGVPELELDLPQTE